MYVAISEPTSAIKSASILPAISSFLRRDNSDQPPITFFTPNLLELTHLYQATRSEEFDFMSHPSWWNVIDSLNLGSAFRTDLEQLARKPVDVDDSSKGTLSFLIDQGVAQMAVHLLPFFQHIFVKCGDRGVLVAMCIPEKDSLASAWARERSNSHKRYIVTHGKAKEIMVLQHFPALPIETVANVTGAGDSFVGALLASVAGEPGSMQHPKGLEEIVSLAQTAAITTLQSHFAVSPRLSELVKL
jgi:pseudouridine-5'-phosphate glycosidase/pseudouridine kinase